MPREFRTSFASRERNRVHARKTRQRKKEQMSTLTTRADELKVEQTRLKQSINEKNTASILVGLFATAGEKDHQQRQQQQTEDPRIEGLLKRKAEDIPDASKITELPALILPGQHNSKKAAKDGGASAASMLPSLSAGSESNNGKDDLPDDGIDYQLLGKDRAKCTPEELDKIRRERNRMHAKRTRDRKRLFMEEMSDMCKQLEEENALLRRHLQILDGETPDPVETSFSSAPTSSSTSSQEHAMTDQFKTLIEVAGSLGSKQQEQPQSHASSLRGMISLSEVASSVATAVSASDSNNSSANASITESHDHDDSSSSAREALSAKRRKIGGSAGLGLPGVLGVPNSITTSVPTVEV